MVYVLQRLRTTSTLASCCADRDEVLLGSATAAVHARSSSTDIGRFAEQPSLVEAWMSHKRVLRATTSFESASASAFLSKRMLPSSTMT